MLQMLLAVFYQLAVCTLSLKDMLGSCHCEVGESIAMALLGSEFA